jgi:GTP-binding protein Era
VTPRAQTTREAVTGILTTAEAQAIFVDTPGLLEPKYALQRAMSETALEVIGDADLILLLLDATRPDELPPEGVVLDAVRRRRDAMIVVVNKIDEGTSRDTGTLEEWSRTVLEVEPCTISAARGDGVAELRARIEAGLPENPFFYPDDDLAVQPMRFFVAELVRETIFEMYEQEVPYSTIVRIEEYREGTEPLYIRATVYVERESQKPIVIGRAGAGIRELGRRSREKIEAFTGMHVSLDLFVKTLPNWRSRLGTLRYLGYRLPASLATEAEASGGHEPGGSGRTGRKSRGRRKKGD